MHGMLRMIVALLVRRHLKQRQVPIVEPGGRALNNLSLYSLNRGEEPSMFSVCRAVTHGGRALNVLCL